MLSSFSSMSPTMPASIGASGPWRSDTAGWTSWSTTRRSTTTRGSAVDADLAVVHQAFETNLFGAWRCCLRAVPLMGRNAWGRIVNVSSEGGSLASMGGGTPAYSTSKAALNALTRVLAAELRGSGIFRWLPGGFFLEQRGQIDFMGLQIESLELIGYDPETGTFPSTVYSNFSPEPLPYKWDVEDETVTISVSHGPLDATFTGSWGEDGTFSGGWRPNPCADESVNVPYDIGGCRLE
jgi:hypothetical protein